MKTATQLAEAFTAALNAHDATKLGEQLAENVTYWEANLPAPLEGREAVEAHFQENWKAFPDATVRVVNRIAGGDWVVDEMLWSGTNEGSIEMPGQPPIPATGKRAEGPGVAVAKAEKGKIASLKVYYDNLAFLMQLGLAPTPESP